MKIIILSTLLSIFFSSTALAKNHYAKVIRVEPVYKYLTISTPREICHSPTYRSRQHSSESTVLGAIIGGTIGNAIGHNSKNGKITTAAGILIGGVVGHELGHQRGTNRYPAQQCVTSYEQTQKVRKLSGYSVLYRYKGQTYQTFSTQKPGKKILIRNKIRLVEHSSQQRSSRLASHVAFQH